MSGEPVALSSLLLLLALEWELKARHHYHAPLYRRFQERR